MGCAVTFKGRAVAALVEEWRLCSPTEAGLNRAIEILRALPDESRWTREWLDELIERLLSDWGHGDVTIPRQWLNGLASRILSAQADEVETVGHQHTFGPWLPTTSYRQVCSCGAYNESSVFADGTDQNRPCAGCGSSLVRCYDARHQWNEKPKTACCPDCDHRKKETDNG